MLFLKPMGNSYADKKILVIRLSSLGDIVRLVPSMETIKKSFGQAVFLTEDRFAAILEMYPMAPNIILFPRKKLGINSFRVFLKCLKENDFDLILDMHGIFKSAFISGLATGKESAGFAKGFGREYSHLFYNRKLICGGSPLISRYERYDGALKALGIEHGEREEFYPPKIDDETESRAGTFLKDNALTDKSYAFLFLGASKKQSFKRWPLFRFQKLAGLIHAKTGLKSVFGWGPDETELAAALKKEEYTVIPPLLNLKETVALILRAKAFVGVDTGLMHLSALSGTNTVAVLGPTSPVLNKPWGGRSRVVFKDGIKKGCSGENCLHEECMGKITEEEVFAELSPLLDR
jgi:heptosyltransferase I